MRSKLRATGVLLVCLLALAGCGDDNGSTGDTGSDTPDTSQETTTPEPTTAPDVAPPDTAPSDEEDDPASEAQQFFTRMDDYAIALDEAASAALDGSQSAVERVARLRAKILDAVNDRLLEGEDTSVGANLLLSAATQAQEAARSGNTARLADARRDIAEARDKLAQELLP